MTIPSDTLRVDTVLLQKLQDDEHYDYGRDLLQVDQESVFSWFMRKLRRWLSELFDSEPMQNLGDWFWPVVCIILILAILAFVYWRRHSLFESAGKVKELAEDMAEDSIYGIDFPEAIATARSRRQWNEVVRLIYLQTLKTLTDTRRIQWRPSKTPTQYLREVQDSGFRTFTHYFMRVRYGGFQADEALCQEMLSLQADIEKGGEE